MITLVVGSAKPNYARVENRLGDQDLKSGEYQEAISHYQSALNEDPRNAVAHNNWGIALERAGQEGAREHFIEAVKLQPDFTLAHFNLSRTLLAEGSRRGAIAGFQQTLRLNPDHVGALNILGRELAKLGEIGESLKLLEKAAELAPSNPEVLNNLGVVYAANGKPDRAMAQFEAVLRIDEAHQEAKRNLLRLREPR